MKEVKFSLSDPIQFLALGFGSGLAPKAPGTIGTLAAIPVFILLSLLSINIYLVVVILLAILGVFICGEAAKAVGEHDHPAIVWDEFVGYFITMLWLPVNWQTVLVGFVLFRFFDIVKPWPISWLDKHCHGGFGIMIDDVVAGVLACFVAHMIF